MDSNTELSLFRVSVGILLLTMISSCFAENPPYRSFARDATTAAPVETYDYIVVGGGTAGCALAATLSASAKVLLLERGDLPYRNPNVTHISGFPLSLGDTSRTSAAQTFVSTDGVVNHRARVLGGGSAINAGFFTKASQDYVRNVGWDPVLVNQSYDWAARKVAFRPELKQWTSAVRAGLLEAGVLPDRGYTLEHLPGTKTGASIFDNNGYRHTASDLLEYANATNIRVYLNATVHQITFNTSGQRPLAYGVLFNDSNGIQHVANLNNGPLNEVIVSSGALGSPQLLMLSGIGPSRQLSAHGINVLVDNEQVGQGMSDNPMNIIYIPSPQPVEISLVQVVGITNVGSYIESFSGFLQFSWAQSVVQEVAKSMNQSIDNFRLAPSNDQMFPEISQGGVGNQDIQAGVVLEKVMGPYSTGHLELQSRDPNVNPRVTFNYFQDPRDLQRCVQGMEIIQRIVESRSFSEFRYPSASFPTLINLMLTIPMNLRTKHENATTSLEQFCRDTVMTIWHYHGGCQVNRVVDRNYKVLGVDGLRVIDGSTFYDSPGANPQATVMMLGRYMGTQILRGRVRGRN